MTPCPSIKKPRRRDVEIVLDGAEDYPAVVKVAEKDNANAAVASAARKKGAGPREGREGPIPEPGAEGGARPLGGAVEVPGAAGAEAGEETCTWIRDHAEEFFPTDQLGSNSNYVREIRDAYDFDTGTFRTGEGEPLTDETLDKWARATTGVRAASAGRRTLKRAILHNTLLRAESRQEPGLLERVLRKPDQLVAGTPLEQSFYQPAEAGQISEIEARFGQTIRDKFGIEPSALTADEATYILGFRDADGLRASIAKARGQRDERLRAKGVRPPETEGEFFQPSVTQAFTLLRARGRRSRAAPAAV